MRRCALLFLLLAGCSSSSRRDAGAQAAYSYPGCEPRTAYCPNDLTYYCALDTIAARHRACADAGECTTQRLSDCGGYTSCRPVAVNAARRVAFAAEAKVEIDRYCTGGSCTQSGTCAETYLPGNVACVEGECVALAGDGGGDPQANYSFPGCSPNSYGCPNDLTYLCALRAIEAKYGSCGDAGECVQASLAGDCVGYSSCPPLAVKASQESAFRGEAGAEVHRYCDGARCGSSGLCALNYAQGRVGCVQGRCVARPDGDDGGL